MWQTVFPQKIDEYVLLDLIRSDKQNKLYKAKTKDLLEPCYIYSIEFPFILKEQEIKDLLSENIHGNILTTFFSEKTLCFVLDSHESLCCLEDLLRSNFASGVLEERLVSLILHPILEEMEYYHSRHVLLYDFHPSRVFIGKEGSIFFLTPMPSVYEKLSKENSLGAYVAPESYLKNKFGPRSDMWSFGILALEMVSGESPKWSDIRKQSLLFSNQPSILNVNSELYSKDFHEVIQFCVKREKNCTATDLLKMPFFTKYATPGKESKSVVKSIFSLCTPQVMDKSSPWIFEFSKDRSPLESCHSDTETDGDEERRRLSLKTPLAPLVETKGRFKIQNDLTLTSPNISDTDSNDGYINEQKGRFNVVTPKSQSRDFKLDNVIKSFKNESLKVNPSLESLGRSPEKPSSLKPKKDETVQLGRFHVKESSKEFPEEETTEINKSLNSTVTKTLIIKDGHVVEKSPSPHGQPQQFPLVSEKHAHSTPLYGGSREEHPEALDGSETQKGRFKIKSSVPDEKYLVKTTLGQQFVIENGNGIHGELVKKILEQPEGTHEGKFKIKEDKSMLLIRTDGEYAQSGEDEVFGDFRVQNVKSPNSLEVANGDFKITSPRKVNGVNLEGKVGRFTVQTLGDQNGEKKKRKVSGERRKKLVSLKKADEINLVTLHAQLVLLRDQNDKQTKLIEMMSTKQDKTDILLRDLTTEIIKLREELKK